MFNKNKHKDNELDEYKDIVTADMNVEGMPWYRKKHQWDPETGGKYDYDEEQQKFIIFGTLKAALLIGGAYIVAFGLFILLIVTAYSLIK